MTDLSRPTSPAMHQQPIPKPYAWRRDDVSESDWRVPVPERAIAEIDEVIAILRANPMDIRALCLDDYPLDACRMLMNEVRKRLDHGVGMAVLDRLPVERHDKESLTAIYWMLSSMISRPVAQSYDGRLLYDVRDTGKKTDTRVRADLTNQEISWHSDYGFNHPPPYLGLLVLRTARSGGVSKAACMMNVHNELLEKRPELLRRLYEPFHWNRQGEHPEGDPLTNLHPIFELRGEQVCSRFNPALVPKGYELVGLQPDALGLEALREAARIMSEEQNHITFVLNAGEIQYVNNFRLAHLRTDYQDYDEPDRKRHLVRIFLRDFGRRSYMG